MTKRAVHVEAAWEVGKEECHSFFSFWFVQGLRPWDGNVYHQGGASFSVSSSFLETPSQACPQVCFTSYIDNEDWSSCFPTRQECKWSLCSIQHAGHSLWKGKSIFTELRSWITIKVLLDFTIVSYFMTIEKEAMYILSDSNNNLWAPIFIYLDVYLPSIEIKGSFAIKILLLWLGCKINLLKNKKINKNHEWGNFKLCGD